VALSYCPYRSQHYFPAYSWILAKRLLSGCPVGWLVSRVSRASVCPRAAEGRQARVCVLRTAGPPCVSTAGEARQRRVYNTKVCYTCWQWAPRVRAHEYRPTYYYRTMHVVIARYCYRKSSVRPSVTLMYRGHIGWTSSKLITWITSLGCSLLGATTSPI